MTGEEVNASALAFKKALIERMMGAELGSHLGQAGGGWRQPPQRPPWRWRSTLTLPGIGSCPSQRVG